MENTMDEVIQMAPYMDSLLWLGITIVFIVMEIFTAGFLFMFFAVGAAITGVLALFNHNLILQGVVFLVSSGIALMYAKPIVKNMFGLGDNPEHLSNSQALVDEEILVLETVKKYEGRVKVVHTGEVWSAYLDPNSGVDSLKAKEEGLVTKIDGAKLCVRPKEA